jgi:hypothetical protein
MATTDYDFVSTRADIIKAAYYKLGVVPFGQTPNADQIAFAASTLNRMVKDWQNARIFLWSIREFKITLDSTNKITRYNIGSEANVIGIDQAFLRTNNQDDPLKIIPFRDYVQFEDKLTVGTTDCVAFCPLLDAPLTGTVSFTNTNTAVTGTSTLFTRELRAGDSIKISSHADSVYQAIASIASDTALTLSVGYTGATLASDARVKFPSKQLYVWPPPVQADVIYGTYICALKDWDSDSTGGDFPPRWERAIVYGLARDMCDDFSIELGHRERITREAELAYRKATGGDTEKVEDSFVSGCYANR